MFLLGVIDLASASASFGISCNLAFHIIWRFMSFGVSCHFAFHVIWRFMSFGVSCHLAFHVILVIIDTKVFMALMLKVVVEDRCVFKKWARWIVIGRYGYKSSFGANKKMENKCGIPIPIYAKRSLEKHYEQAGPMIPMDLSTGVGSTTCSIRLT